MSDGSAGVALAALVLALAVGVWAYGVYCYVQMVRHRRPGVSTFSLAWPVEYLSERGLQFRRRALWSYAAFAALAFLLILLGNSLAAESASLDAPSPGRGFICSTG